MLWPPIRETDSFCRSQKHVVDLVFWNYLIGDCDLDVSCTVLRDPKFFVKVVDSDNTSEEDAFHCRYKFKFEPCDIPDEGSGYGIHLFDGDIDCGMVRLTMPDLGYFCTLPAGDRKDHYRFWRMPWAVKRPMPFAACAAGPCRTPTDEDMRVMGRRAFGNHLASDPRLTADISDDGYIRYVATVNPPSKQKP